MTFEDLAQKKASWLDGTGRQPALVVSSRVRLARNLSTFPFPQRASEHHHREIIRSVVRACRGDLASRMSFFETSQLSDLQQQFLVERHLISPALTKGQVGRGVLVDPNERLSVMVNEEDHFRFQVILPGFQAPEAWQSILRLERELSTQMTYAFSNRWGFLTACPTNTGTGLRASILIHLPGLVLTREIDGVVRGVTQMGFVVRGLYGEGTDVAGNLFQVSNQMTLGRSEESLLEILENVIGQLIACEENARETLFRDARTKMEDKIWRAQGILKYARLLTSQEFMNLSSAVRLGVGVGLIQDVEVRTLNEMMVETQPAHLQHLVKRRLEAQERDTIRAEMVRLRMNTSND